jgi:hypothetical protein
MSLDSPPKNNPQSVSSCFRVFGVFRGSHIPCFRVFGVFRGSHIPCFRVSHPVFIDP